MSLRVISWEEYIAPHPLLPTPYSLSLTIGVFDGVHRGHQSLIRYIVENGAGKSSLGDATSPSNDHCSLLTAHCSLIPTVVTFRQNPQQILKPGAFSGDIITLEQKLAAVEFFGVELAVLIDFSCEFSKMRGRAFIDLLLGCQPVKLLALGRNFRCGHRLDTGAEEIQSLAAAQGLETWVAPPVMDEGQPVSSSRIRQALAAGRKTEADRLMNWPPELIF